MVLEDNIKKVHPDISLIKRTLGSCLVRLGVFGSFLDREFEKVHDIDLALFLEGMSLKQAKNELQDLPLSYPVRCREVNGHYGMAPKKEGPFKKDFHIILLNAKRPNPKFMRLNEDAICFV